MSVTVKFPHQRRLKPTSADTRGRIFCWTDALNCQSYGRTPQPPRIAADAPPSWWKTKTKPNIVPTRSDPKLRAIPPATPVYVCDPVDLRLITGFDFHRGCLALAERPEPIAMCEILRDAVTLVILEGVTNADNVGGVFRNAAAFGVDGVLLSPTCCDPLYRKAIRTSMAASLRVPFARIDSWPDGLADVRACGFTLVALTPREPSQTLDAFVQGDRPPRVALLVGTEGAGLSNAAELLADRRVRIPISRAVDSLNLAVTTGIVLSRLSAEPAL